MSSNMTFELSNSTVTLIQNAVASALAGQLGTVLPEMVKSMITKKATYGDKNNIVERAITSMIKAECEKQIYEVLQSRQEEIKAIVTAVVDSSLSPQAIAENVTNWIGEYKIRVQPFRKVAIPPVSEDDDEDNVLE